MSNEDRLTDLLVAWEDAAANGDALTPEEHCRDHPDLLDAFLKLLAQLGPVNAVLREGRGRDLDLLSPSETASVNGAAPESAVSRGPIPGYELLSELGRGGMGVVYKARQLGLGRFVALKMILAGGYAGTQERTRFGLEAEAVARLQHPNIVQVYEVGEHDGRPYFSLEFCANGNLRQKLAAGPLPPRDAAGIAEQLARGMAVAHAAGVVHRDLKPANVLLAGDNTPKVADFGLAKLLDNESGQTVTEAVLGTPSYMSPEQASGNSRTVGPSADVYALGAILYEMLTGGAPFRGSSVTETLELVRSQDPAPIRRLQPKVPRDLETICLKCLQKEPARRYTSAEALADDLRRFLSNEPIRARPVGRIERSVKWVRRNPALAGALGVVAAALIVGTVVSMLFAAETAKKAADEARAASGERDARGQAERREGEAIQARNEAVTARNDAEGAKNDAVKARNDLATKATALEIQVYKSRVALAYQDWQLVNARAARVLLGSCQPDRRGWEWEYVNQLCNLQKRRLPPAPNVLIAVAVRPDGEHMVTVAMDSVARVYETQSLRLVTEIKPTKPNPVRAGLVWAGSGRRVAYSPDGSLLAVAAMHDTVVLLDGRDPTREVGRLKDPTTLHEWFNAVAFSPDGKILATAGGHEGVVESYRLKLWSVPDRKLLKTFTGGHTHSIIALAFHPTNGRIAASGLDKHIIVWHPDRDTPVLDLGEQKSPSMSLAFSPDGKVLASSTENGLVQLWDAETGKLKRTLEGHSEYVNAVTFSPEGDQLASGGFDGNIKVWDPVEGRELFTLRGHQWNLMDLAYRRGKSELVAVGPDNDLRIWDVSRDRQHRVFDDHVSPLSEGQYSPKGRWIALVSGASSTEQPALHLYDAKTGGRARTVSLKSAVCDYLPVASLAFHPEDQLLATASGHLTHGEVVVCKPENGEFVWRRSLGTPLSSVVFSHDGKHLAVSSGTSKKVVILDAFTGNEVKALEFPGTSVYSLAWSADGALLAAGGHGAPIQLWRTANWEASHALKATPTQWCRSMAFHPKGKYLAVGTDDAVVVLFDPATGKEVRRLVGHGSSIGCVTFSPDGNRLFSTGTGDAFVKVWDPELTEDLFTLRLSRSWVRYVHVHPAGRRLLVTSPGLVAHEFCAHEFDTVAGK